MRRLVLLLVVGMAVAVPAVAAPNWIGETGLLLTPTADALDSRQWNAAFHHISDVANIATANLGVSKGLEVGVTWWDPDRRGDTKFTGQVKYRILSETAGTPGLAVGWWDVADEIDSTPYVVGSKKLTDIGGFALRGHLGFGGGIYDDVFAGLDLNLAPNLSAMAEWDGNDLNAGIRWGLPKGFRIDLGSVSDELGVGLSYNAGF